MATSAQFYQLQKIDLTTEKVRRRLLQIQQATGESRELKALREQTNSTRAELRTWEGKQLDAELEAKSLRSRIAETDRQLMSGRVRVPKELESLQSSLDSLRRQLSTVEDAGVEAVLYVEQTDLHLRELEDRLAHAEAEWQAGQGDLAEEDQKMKRNYTLLKKQREAVVQSLTPDALAEYERLRQRKGGVAVATVENGVCAACHVKLPTGVASSARSGGIVTCPSCGRILYVP